ncbi:MAG: LPS export ABC transporter periplasmic protein LptC [Leptolyngbya sp. DLM2.Bin15]|nr:MAG: LPS export ABC transporter periplasmic protein LptC [Leptolyngbya sp. DLM2.Bin15]
MVKPWLKWTALSAVVALVVAGGVFIYRRSDTPPEISDAPQQEIDDRFILNNVTLDQANENGETVWSMRATRAIYSPDQQTAEVENPEGELFQDGEAIYRVEGDRGVVQRDGRRITLRGNITATDLRTGAEMTGGELVWVPADDTMTIRNGLTGTHPDLTVEADQGQLFGRDQRVELTGNVTIEGREPRMKLTGESLEWQMEEQIVSSDRPVDVQRLQGQGERTRVTDQASSNEAEYRLAEQRLSMNGNVRMAMREPVMSLATESLVWEIENQLVTMNRPLNANLRNGQVLLQGDRGSMDLAQEIFDLRGSARATTRRNQSRLRGDRIVWDNGTQEVEAIGNVFYTQADPEMSSRAPRLVGTLEDQVFVMSGGRVVTEFIPGEQ